jgi:hypothetical protein
MSDGTNKGVLDFAGHVVASISTRLPLVTGSYVEAYQP